MARNLVRLMNDYSTDAECEIMISNDESWLLIAYFMVKTMANGDALLILKIKRW